MFQYMWFNKKNFNKEIDLPEVDKEDWIFPKDIEMLSISKWCEHCLECAVPLCYGNCENWIEREDKKCQKTFYGTYRKDTKGQYIQAAQLRFREWGKIETILYKGFLSVDSYQRLDRANTRNEKAALMISRLIKHFSPKYRICGAQVYFTNMAYKKKGERLGVETFVIQCYSPTDKSYRLLIEFYTPEGVYFRNSLEIKKGYNQGIFEVKGVFSCQEGRVRIYPENNIQEEIIFFLCDFVKLKNRNQDCLYADKIKCVAWDLDNTIWDGTLIESNSDELKLRDGILDTIKALDERGIIQIISSKNDENDAISILKKLGIYDYFVLFLINWNPKSDNIIQAAKELNININSFAFVDDLAFERGEVREHINTIRIYKETDISYLLDYPEFDVVVTKDSAKRRIMYQTEMKRKVIENNFIGSNVDFLKDCQLNMTIKRIDSESFMRSYELIQRTNQLNLSGIKYSKSDFRTLCENKDYECYVAFCRDKFGEYGQVGYFCFKVSDNAIQFKEYVMSCRVAGKWIEPALMKWLLAKYHIETIDFLGFYHKKNDLLIRTLKEFGFQDKTEGNELHLHMICKNMNWEDVVKVTDET